MYGIYTLPLIDEYFKIFNINYISNNYFLKLFPNYWIYPIPLLKKFFINY